MTTNQLVSIEKIISKALVDSGVSYEEFTLAINVEQSYLTLKERCRIKNSRQGNVEKNTRVEHGKQNWNWRDIEAEWKTKSKIQKWTIKYIEIVKHCYCIVCSV